MLYLIYLTLLAVGAAGVGRILLRRLELTGANVLEKGAFAVGLGLGVLALLLLALGLARLLYAPVIDAGLALWLGVGVWDLVRRPPRLPGAPAALSSAWRAPELWVLAALVAGQGLGLARALAPPHGMTDPLAYQLALPKLYLVRHFLSFEPTITGALYPGNMNLLYLAAMAVRDGSLAQVVHWFMGAMTCVGIAGLAWRYYSLRAGIWAAAVFGFTPVIVVFGPLGYIDVGLCFFQFLAFWALANHLAQGEGRRWLILAGLLAGLAMGVKHQGLATLAVGLVILAGEVLRRRQVRQLYGLLVFAAVAVLVASPWYARSYAQTGNPVWPLAGSVFGDPGFTAPPTVMTGVVEKDAGLLGGVIPPLHWWSQYWETMSPWTWTFQPPGWQKAIGPYYLALLPALVLLWRSRAMWLLLGACALYYGALIRALHMNPRYGLVLFAYLSILCGLVAERYAGHRRRPLRLAFAVLFAISLVLNLSWAWFQSEPLMAVAIGRQSRESFLVRNEPGYRVFAAANQTLPEGAFVLLQGIVKGYYCDRRYMWDHPHQGVLVYDRYATPEALLARMRELGITHVIRMIQIPAGRLSLGYPQYFASPFHEEFRRRYLELLYRDEAYAMFAVNYGARP
ncbi:MAG: glycosyltransferase family 39 protein [Gemmatimonadota bacterium]